MNRIFNSLSRKVSILVVLFILLSTVSVSYLSYNTLKRSELSKLDAMHKVLHSALNSHIEEIENLLAKAEKNKLDITSDTDLEDIETLLTSSLNAPSVASAVLMYPDMGEVEGDNGKSAKSMKLLGVSSNMVTDYELTSQSSFAIPAEYIDAMEKVSKITVKDADSIVQTKAYSDGVNNVVSTLTPLFDEKGNHIANVGIDFKLKSLEEKLAFNAWISVGIVAVVSIISATIVLFLISSQLAPIKRLRESIAKAAQGDFTHTLNIDRSDELGQMGVEFNEMLASLQGFVGVIQKSAAANLVTAQTVQTEASDSLIKVQTIFSSIEEIEKGSSYQKDNTEQTVLALQEMAVSTQEIAESTSVLSEKITNVSSKTESSRNLVKSAVDTIEDTQDNMVNLSSSLKNLADQSSQIMDIVNNINIISSQSNLLSLNASIEAARAGEHGKGFAVVAEEVRKLSTQTKESSIHIGAVLKNITEGVIAVADAIETTKSSVSGAVSSITEVHSNIEIINQEASMLSDEVQTVSASTQQMSASSEETLATMESLASISANIDKMTKNISEAVSGQVKSSEEVSKYAKDLLNASEEVTEKVNLFKV